MKKNSHAFCELYEEYEEYVASPENDRTALLCARFGSVTLIDEENQTYFLQFEECLRLMAEDTHLGSYHLAIVLDIEPVEDESALMLTFLEDTKNKVKFRITNPSFEIEGIFKCEVKAGFLSISSEEEEVLPLFRGENTCNFRPIDYVNDRDETLRYIAEKLYKGMRLEFVQASEEMRCNPNYFPLYSLVFNKERQEYVLEEEDRGFILYSKDEDNQEISSRNDFLALIGSTPRLHRVSEETEEAFFALFSKELSLLNISDVLDNALKNGKLVKPYKENISTNFSVEISSYDGENELKADFFLFGCNISTFVGNVDSIVTQTSIFLEFGEPMVLQNLFNVCYDELLRLYMENNSCESLDDVDFGAFEAEIIEILNRD